VLGLVWGRMITYQISPYKISIPLGPLSSTNGTPLLETGPYLRGGGYRVQTPRRSYYVNFNTLFQR